MEEEELGEYLPAVHVEHDVTAGTPGVTNVPAGQPDWIAGVGVGGHDAVQEIVALPESVDEYPSTMKYRCWPAP